jgi:putative intracellular protease/amidase
VVAAICHAPWMLCSAKILTGRKATSYFSIRDDMEHAGAVWSDAEVVVDTDTTHGGMLMFRFTLRPFTFAMSRKAKQYLGQMIFV